MGYRIDYKFDGKDKNSKKGWVPVLAAAAVICTLLVIMAVFFPEKGREILLEVFFPGDIAVTAASLNNMVEELKIGTPFIDAFRTFCRQVIAG